jgi:diketogulonate reductase-like aldo/keto reductase
VKNALEVGYRFFDCAQFYNNEKQVGAAIASAGIPRAELYLASKVWSDNIYEGADAVKAQVEKTISDLGTDYLDLYCIHWPVPYRHIDSYVALQELQQEGKIRSLGLSNYTIEDYEELVGCSDVFVRPCVNQIEINPFLYRKRTIEYFQAEGVQLQSYRSLRDGKEFQHPLLIDMAHKHGRTVAQILGRWCLQKGCIFIPKSNARARMEENILVLDFALDDLDMEVLDTLTESDSIEIFQRLYEKCVVRDTPGDEETMRGVKTKITLD